VWEALVFSFSFSFFFFRKWVSLPGEQPAIKGQAYDCRFLSAGSKSSRKAGLELAANAVSGVA
jgi:hypothetical protein